VAAHNLAAARLAPPAPDDADEEEVELEDDTLTYPVISVRALEAGDERRYR
jgi:hypothetical protein